MIGFSSLRETLLEGETSSSQMNVEERGEYIWSEDGWDEGRRSVDVRG